MGFTAGTRRRHVNAGDMRLKLDPWVGKVPWRRAWQPTPVFLLVEFPWTEEPGGLQSVRSQRVGGNCVAKHTEFRACTLLSDS